MFPQLLDEVHDPDLKKLIKESLINNPLHAPRYLEYEIELKQSGKPYDQHIIDHTFTLATGYHHDEEGIPSPPGTSHINIEKLKEYGTMVFGADKARDMMLKAAAKDPEEGIRYAIRNYPEAPDSIPVYLTMLPRANELLNTGKHANMVISMLNKLEPSQYAGQPYKIIPEKDAFKLLDGTNSGQLYDLITNQASYSYSNLIKQGVYNEASKRLYEGLKREGKSLSDIVNSTPEREEKLMDFVTIASTYQRMGGFIASTPPEDHLLVAQKLLQKEKWELDIPLVTEFIKNLPRNSHARSYIESTIVSKALGGDEYEKANMGVLANWYAHQNDLTISPENRAFYDRAKSDPSFEVQPLDKIKSANLLDAAGRNFQLHAFYNDKDGIDTFNSFSASLKADGYRLKQQNDFLIFSKEKNGKKIDILVSPPESNGAVIPKILDYVREKNGVISVISGRGHSHHMSEAVELITPDAKIVSLGGCWGHSYTRDVLNRSPDAHILATTGVGRMSINNFNTKWINDQILSGHDLNWQGLKSGWDRLKKDKTLAEDISSYVSPDDNISLLYEHHRAKLYEMIDQKNSGVEPASNFQQSFMQSMRGVSAATAPQNQPAPSIASPSERRETGLLQQPS